MRRALAAALVLLTGCSTLGLGGDDTTEELADPTGSGTAEVTGADDDRGQVEGGTGGSVPIEAAFVEGSCGFPLPTSGPAPRCGTVTVPMDWATGTGRIDLAVAVFPSTATEPAPDPVVYLEGGPGGHALEQIRFLVADLLDPLRARSDVVFFDQRGAGLSEPRLDCPEIEALTRELEDTPSVAEDEADRRFHDSLRACRDRLEAEGIDLAAYTSIDNAHDVEAIRTALGYERWNLYGISYGTKLALEVIRQHPEAVRTAVLDSVFPPQVDSVRENPATFVASFDAVVAACEAEPECAAGGDLGARLRDVVQRYDADPVPVVVRDLLTGESDEIFVRGETIVELVTEALYSPRWFTDLPELVAELEDGATGAVELFLSQQRTTEQFFTDGMFYAIDCNEEVAFADIDEVAAALPADPFGLRDRFDYASNNGTRAFATCDAFGTGPASPVLDQAVESDIWALVMTGRFDPVTPVSWAETAAATLPNSHLVVDPVGSHGVSVGDCGIDIVVDFLDEPETRPDTSCLDEGDLRFLAAPDSSVTLEAHTFTTPTGLEVRTVRPEGWVHGDLPGDSYRQASFLDPTQVLQVAGNPALRTGLELYLGQTFDIAPSGTGEEPEVGGRRWVRRAGRSGGVAVEWYETTIASSPVFVVLVSTEDELEANIGNVLLPVLEAIAIG